MPPSSWLETKDFHMTAIFAEQVTLSHRSSTAQTRPQKTNRQSRRVLDRVTMSTVHTAFDNHHGSSVPPAKAPVKRCEESTHRAQVAVGRVEPRSRETCLNRMSRSNTDSSTRPTSAELSGVGLTLLVNDSRSYIIDSMFDVENPTRQPTKEDEL